MILLLILFFGFKSFAFAIGNRLKDTVSIITFKGWELSELKIYSIRGVKLNSKVFDSVVTIKAFEDKIIINYDTLSKCKVTSLTGGFITLKKDSLIKRTVRGVVYISCSNGLLNIVSKVPIKDYLASTLACETSVSEPIEYMIALSVLQRNYFVSHLARHDSVDLCDNTHCQKAFSKIVTSKHYTAISKGLKIRLGKLDTIPCYYSANCGGRTLTPLEVWNNEEYGYSSIECNNCSKGKYYRWVREIVSTTRVDEFLRSANETPFIDDNFKIRFGREFGFNIILSNTVDKIEKRNKKFIIHGKGFGHRIGLCQEGAIMLAKKGFTPMDILRYYFPNVSIITDMEYFLDK